MQGGFARHRVSRPVEDHLVRFSLDLGSVSDGTGAALLLGVRLGFSDLPKNFFSCLRQRLEHSDFG